MYSCTNTTTVVYNMLVDIYEKVLFFIRYATEKVLAFGGKPRFLKFRRI